MNYCFLSLCNETVLHEHMKKCFKSFGTFNDEIESNKTDTKDYKKSEPRVPLECNSCEQEFMNTVDFDNHNCRKVQKRKYILQSQGKPFLNAHIVTSIIFTAKFCCSKIKR